MSETETAPAAVPKPLRPPRINRAVLRRLREPIPPHNIGKKPRVYCWACNQASEGRACEEHIVRWCDTCRSTVSNAHEHDDYVGHAETTDRFLEADLTWNWRPMATDERGLPAFDDDGGMWIYLTVGGVERLGYGSANGKRGGSAIKEVISDALKNAGIRFGTGLDQRAQTDLHAKVPDQDQDQAADTAAPLAEPKYADPNWIARVGSLLARKRGSHGEDRPRVLSEILEHEVTDVAKLSPDDARKAVRILSGGPDHHPPAPTDAGPAEPPAEPALAQQEPEPSPTRATVRKTSKQRMPAPQPGNAPAVPGIEAAHVRTINSLLSSRGVADNDTAARLRIISAALARTVGSLDELSHADAEVLIRQLGSGEVSVDPPQPTADGAEPETGPEHSTFDDICKQIARAITDEDAGLIKIEIGKALTNGSITQADGGALVERLEKRGRQVGLAGGS